MGFRKKINIAIGFVFIFTLIWLSPFGVVFNPTFSVPTGIYITDKYPAVKKNDYVIFKFSCDDCVWKGVFSSPPSGLFIKEVLLSEGDTVCMKDGVYYDEKGILIHKVSEKIKSRWLSEGECKKVENGYIYVGSGIDAGFDSRYFGPIKKESVIKEAYLLLEI